MTKQERIDFLEGQIAAAIDDLRAGMDSLSGATTHTKGASEAAASIGIACGRLEATVVSA